MKRILITGMSGLIGGLLRKHLEEAGGYRLRALNRRPIEGVDVCQADVADLNAIQPAFEDIDVVVHLAASLDLEDWQSQLSSNLIGAYNVYEASRRAGVKRVVFASSGNTIRGFEREEPYRSISEGRYGDVPEHVESITHEQVRPQSIYGAAKVWGEAIGRVFSDDHGLSVLCVRIGLVTAEDRPAGPRAAAVYLSHRDIAEVLHRCIEAPADVSYGIFFATSNNRWGYRDLSHTREVLGFVPQDSAEERMG